MFSFIYIASFDREIQSINDTLMPSRMLKYASLIYEHYGEFPKQMVLYVGDRDIKIKSKIKEKNFKRMTLHA